MGQQSNWRGVLRWLTPGLGIKRWLLLLALGVGLLSAGLAFALREIYPLPRVFYYLTLQFLPHWARALGFGAVGAALIGWAWIKFSRALLAPFARPDMRTWADTLYQHRVRDRGPRVVAIGGGHGLSTLLRGLKEHTSNITAIVTVADDGGSSGRLRRELGVLPPGDFRNCIAALADDEALITQLFQYRFGDGAGLEGHSFGNLFITAMAGITGSFERAIVESGRVLAVRGRVLPSTLRDVTLVAELRNGDASTSLVRGESNITQAGARVERVSLLPDYPAAYPEAVRAILEADLIVAGPGSLYTSILPNLLVPDIAQAIRASRATKVFVCNVATQRGETDGYTAGDHVAALVRHVGDLFPVVVANSEMPACLGLPDRVEWVVPVCPDDRGCNLLAVDLLDRTVPWRHDSEKLAQVLLRLCRSD